MALTKQFTNPKKIANFFSDVRYMFARCEQEVSAEMFSELRHVVQLFEAADTVLPFRHRELEISEQHHIITNLDKSFSRYGIQVNFKDGRMILPLKLESVEPSEERDRRIFEMMKSICGKDFTSWNDLTFYNLFILFYWIKVNLTPFILTDDRQLEPCDIYGHVCKLIGCCIILAEAGRIQRPPAEVARALVAVLPNSTLELLGAQIRY